MSDAGSDGEHVEEQPNQYQHHYVPRGPIVSSPMADYPTSEELRKVLTEDSDASTPCEPTGWWSSHESTRPWREKPDPKRRASAPPEQVERWTRTKKRVALALSSTLSYGLDVTHELLQVGADIFSFAPVPGLEDAARVLLTIWDALQLVETNRMACLRLTERCADILLSIREEIHEAGDKVGEELTVPLQKLVDAFKSVHILLQKQVHRPFLKRYLKRDDILRNINGCDAALSDALSLFSVSIQIRTLRQLQAAEVQMKANLDKLIASSSAPQTNKVDVDIDATPKQKFKELPRLDEPSAPPPYTTTNSGSTGNSQSTGSSAGKTTSTSSSDKPAVETVQSPPPTPDSHMQERDASQMTLHAPPAAEEVRAELSKLVERQNSMDHELDLADLRALMREALATSTDVEMLRVLQINREDIAEAMKTLQRALERECEKEEAEAEQVISPETSEEAVTPEAEGKGRSRGALQLSGLKRRLTMDSTTTKASRKSKNSKKDGKGSRRSKVERDTLDREFIETGIDALRRLSRGQDINLPSWTITRYEIDMEEKIGIGYFSDVYRARWRNQTVAVKVLTLATPQRLFIHEMNVWKSLQHPNVLPLLGASSATGDPPWFLVSPFMKNGNLVDYLRSARKPIDAAVERRMIYEVAKGMAYLHRQGVMHGDLKGTNVLIDDKGHCMITDFGQSEMKSEAYRLSGNHPPRGTLRWQAPEIVDGASSGSLTYQVDIYAYAIVCVEIFGHGTLPWGVIEDDAYRRLVIEEDKRPPITSPNCSKGILAIIEMCWARDPAKRPTFQKVVRELRNLGLNKYSDSPTVKTRLIDDDSKRSRHSPDMRPVDLPDGYGCRNCSPPCFCCLPKLCNIVEPDEYVRRRSSSARSSPGPMSSANRSHALSTGAIPIQRIITPIREEDKDDGKGASPVDYRPIRLPEVTQPAENGLHARDMRVRSKSEGADPVGVARNGSTSTSQTESSDANTDPYAEGPGLPLERVESPPPADELIAQRKNESRYRLTLQHAFHPSLVLPLWEPCPVQLGAVGYLLRPHGRFMTLFNAFDPPKTSEGRANGMSNLFGYGKIEKGNQRQDRRNVAQKSMDIIQGLLWFRSRTTGDYQQNVSRRVSFPIHAGRKSAYLYVEQTMYRYIADLATPKSWFQANVDKILDIYASEHRLQKEDVFLIVGTLDTPDYGLFVNHNNPDGQVHFNVFAYPKSGQKWGTFAVDTDTLPPNFSLGPSWHEDVPGKHASANKVSEVNPARPWETVLLARLRFRPDDDKPTAL